MACKRSWVQVPLPPLDVNLMFAGLFFTLAIALPVGYQFGIWWGFAIALMFLLVFGALFLLAWYKVFNSYAVPKSILFYAHLAGVPLLSSGFIDFGIGWGQFKLTENPQIELKAGGINTATPNLYLIGFGSFILISSYLIAGWMYVQERRAELAR